jgi:hypothetical protein
MYPAEARDLQMPMATETDVRPKLRGIATFVSAVNQPKIHGDFSSYDSQGDVNASLNCAQS